MPVTDHMTDLEFTTLLKAEVTTFYYKLFNLGVGGRFHAFVEWCGVMTEHLNITSDLLQQGLPAFEMNQHTGETPPIAGFRLAYLADKMECIFDGTIEVKVAGDKTAGKSKPNEPEAPKPFTMAAVDAAILAITGAPAPVEMLRDKKAIIKQIRNAALHGWERNRAEDEHSRALRDALTQLQDPPVQTIFKKIPSHWTMLPGERKFLRQDGASTYEANGRWHGYLMTPSGMADTVTDDREEDQVGDGLGFGERELNFATAEEMIKWIDDGYPIEEAIKLKFCA